jgi:hypothetical protein
LSLPIALTAYRQDYEFAILRLGGGKGSVVQGSAFLMLDPDPNPEPDTGMHSVSGFANAES